MKMSQIVEYEAQSLYEFREHAKNILEWGPVMDVLMQEVNTLENKDGYFFEIGTGIGVSTCTLAAASKICKCKPLFSIDWNVGQGEKLLSSQNYRDSVRSQWDVLCNSLAYCGVHDHVILIRSDSISISDWLDVPISLLYLDGDHGIGYVSHELSTYGSMVMPGGKILLYCNDQDENSATTKEYVWDNYDNSNVSELGSGVLRIKVV